MKKTKFTEAQIVFALRPVDMGITVAEARRKKGVSEATSYKIKVEFILMLPSTPFCWLTLVVGGYLPPQ